MKDLDAGAVDLLLILGGNPVFNAPVELGMRDRLRKARLRVHLSLYEDETSELCQWQPAGSALPGSVGRCARLRWHGHHPAAAHPAALRRPLGATQILQMLTERRRRNGYEIVQGLLGRRSTRARDFEAWWRRAVHDGVVRRYGAARQDARAARRSHPRARRGARTWAGKLEVIFRPDPTIYDGRFANNGWLQELPKPITKLTWDNAAI